MTSFARPVSTAAPGTKNLLEEAGWLREILARLSTKAQRDIEEMVDRYLKMGMSPNEVAGIVQNLFPDIVQRYVDSAAAMSTEWYGDLAPDQPYVPEVPVDPVKAGRLLGTARWATESIADGVFDEARRQQLVSKLGGEASRAVFDGSREAIAYNTEKESNSLGNDPMIRYYRVARPDACLFCATLATRGAVYFTSESAEAGHAHCQCVAVPERPGTVFVKPEYYEMFERRYNEAALAVGPQSEFGDKSKNAYFKAVLAEMRKQEAALGKEFDLLPAWDHSDWTPHRKTLRRELDSASTLADLQKAAQALIDDRPPPPNGLSMKRTFVIMTDSAFAQNSNAILTNKRPNLVETPGVLENVRGAIRAVDDFQHRYPGVEIEGLTFHMDGDNTFAATWRMNPWGWNEGSSKINMNATFMNAASDNVHGLVGGLTFDTEFDRTVDSGFHYRRDGGDGDGFDRGGKTGQPSSYAVMTHELGHALSNSTNAGGLYRDSADAPRDVAKRIPARADHAGLKVESALSDYYVRRHIGAERWKSQGGNWTAGQLQAFETWKRDNMSGYCFETGTGNGLSVNGIEAVAEAFADVEINGKYARETSKVMHAVLVDYYKGDSPYAATQRGILDGDPDFYEWPDFRPSADAMPEPIQYHKHRLAGTQPVNMSGVPSGRTASGVEQTRVEIPYVRNNTGMRGVAGFGQDSEPWGRYMAPAGDGDVILQKGWERGTATLERPRYVDHDGGNWKARLSAEYGGATGEDLSRRLLEDGFDGVVTRDDSGIVEFVDVRPRSQRRYTVEVSTSTWQESGIPPLVNTSWDDAQYTKVDDKRLSKAQRAEARRVVDERYKELAAGTEAKITGAVYQTLVDAGAVPHGLEYRLKEPPSLYRKVQGEMADKGISASEALGAMRDTVRFTAIVPEDGYWKAGSGIRDQLLALGAEMGKDPAGIALEGYRGRNMTFRLDGVEFELQIHTEKSMAVKDVCHKLYEIERLPDTPLDVKKKLHEQQQRLWDTIPMTKGTPMIEKEKSPDVLFTIESNRMNVGPTVPKIHNADGSVTLPYGSKRDGLVHPDIDMMTRNVVSDDLAAWERLTPEQKEWGILWYKRLNWFLAEDALGTVYEGDQRRLAAIYAALSPRTDFDVNYAAVRQVLSMEPREIQRLVSSEEVKAVLAAGKPFPADEFGDRPQLNGVLPDNLNRLKRILAVDDSGKWVVDDPVWALRSTGASDLYYRRPARDRVRLYHRTSLEAADSIRVQRRFISNEGDDVFFSDELGGQALGYGQGVVVVDVPRARWQPKKGEWTPGIDDDGNFHGIAGRVDDEFPRGEKHYALSLKDIDEKWIVQPSEIPSARAENAKIALRREAYERRVYDAVKAKGGITINLEGDVPVAGFAFAPSKGTEVRIPKALFTVEDIDHYIDAHLDQLQRPGCHLGLWVEGDDVFLDVSKVGKASAATIKQAQDVDQLAVYDLSTNDVVTIGEESPDGGYAAAGKASDILTQHKREVERRDQSGGEGGAGEVPRSGSAGEELDGAIEPLYLEVQHGPKDQAALEAAKIYNHALNVLDELDDWAVTVDTWDARVKLGIRADGGEARRVLDSGRDQREKMEIYQEFAEATRRATEIIRGLDPDAREFARLNGYMDLLPKHIQAAVWGAARMTVF